MQEFHAITLPLPFNIGRVNCYLMKTATGFVLVDTGSANKRAELEDELARAGCQPGSLGLIVLTHGDFDHTGNAAHLRETYGAKIAMHRDDAGMAEQGDMFWGRSSGSALLRLAAPVLFRFPRSNRFVPDLYVEEGDDLSAFGFDARILSIPGHSKGSIGVLTAAGDLFCGDLLENDKEPALGSIIDDPADAQASVEKLKVLEIKMVYPGHGRPFPMGQFRGGIG
jgi:hydroxyacylglutathione hydrolase